MNYGGGEIIQSHCFIDFTKNYANFFLFYVCIKLDRTYVCTYILVLFVQYVRMMHVLADVTVCWELFN